MWERQQAGGGPCAGFCLACVPEQPVVSDEKLGPRNSAAVFSDTLASKGNSSAVPPLDLVGWTMPSPSGGDR